HPLGIKPYGNLLFDKEHPNFIPNLRSRGLGSLSKLSDELLLEVLSYLDGISISSLANLSPMFYILSYLEDNWKERVVKEFNGDFMFKGSWRQTYLERKYNSKLFPVKVKWIYSDNLYQSWLCTSNSMYQYLGKENIERRSNLSYKEFIEEYELPNKPVIITDIVNKWPAFNKWNEDYLMENFDTQDFIAESVNIKLKNYFQYSNNNRDESPIYLFDKHFTKNCPNIDKDFEVPEYFKDDLFSLLGEDKRPDYRWLIIGPKRSGSTFHKDPNATSAWNAVITGSKKWILFPPNQLPPGVFTNSDESEVTSPVSIMEWHLNYYKLAQEYQPIEAICKAGEIMFVPSGWWHLVVNLDDSIAITQNYVSHQNVDKVLKFLYFKEEQISGWDCNKNGPLFDAFEKEYAKLNPELVENIKSLKKETKIKSNWEILTEDNNKEKDNNDNNVGGFSFNFNFDDENE
ncbi:Clavaminate synthase-like protein, partial [Neoconidiobolus thromboides FSU 785]